MKKIEILAPVGSWENLHVAINAGADAIYFGVGNLNMRSRSSSNFTLVDLEKIIKICRENNVKAYVTVNTVVYDNEIEELNNLIFSLSKLGVDAVIASDLSVINLCRENNLRVHASTQLNISNFEAVKFFSKYVDVIVLARELSLKQVKNICDKIIEEKICGPSGDLLKIEIFVHGALCMAISGKCYLSLDNFNLSANRGECIQVCRRAYKVEDKDQEVQLEIDNEYIMSPKDLKTINFLDKIIDAGVSVLKIEGRARSAEYVNTVIKTYKEAVNCIMNNNFTKQNIDLWNENLDSVFNRGYWDGYYLGQRLGEWSLQGGSQAKYTKEYIGKITNYFNKINVAEITLESGKLQLDDKILIIGQTTGLIELNVNEIRVNLQLAQEAIKSQVCSIPLNSLVRRNDKVYKLVVNKDIA